MENLWSKIKTFFKDSETIFWARLQVVGAAAAGAWTYFMSDETIQDAIKTMIDPKYVPLFVIGLFAVNGLFTEYLRRRRTDI